LMEENSQKVAVLACSGIGKVFGALARETMYELVERVRPDTAVTLCLSLLVINDPVAIRLVTASPVMTIDGCPKECARKSLESHGVRAAKACQAIDFYKAHKDLKPEGIGELDEAGRKLAALAADELAEVVDRLAGRENQHGN
jgi:uncharacterized metal-binding protein